MPNIIPDNIKFITAAAGGTCPSGFMSTETDCYYISNTTDFTKLLTWSKAKDKCASFGSGSHLITIDDENDQVLCHTQKHLYRTAASILFTIKPILYETFFLVFKSYFTRRFSKYALNLDV